ncbi:MAG: flagellar basal-body MS-ring/collar protein FliF [Legionella sp.]|jgi:flagellar M-ring protein FliF
MNWQLTQAWFYNASQTRKLHIILSSSGLLLLISLICWWGLTPSYDVLFQHLEEQDANRVINQLDQSQIHYQLRNNGQDIFIDKNLIPKTRLKIMASDASLNPSIGFELFDKSDFGMTDFSQKINYQRALQGELERTIASFDEVNSVRVHISIPENHVFDQKEQETRAAVSVNLKSPLSQKQVSGIQQVLSNAVPNLLKANVVVVDQNGKTLSQSKTSAAKNYFSAKKSIEHYLTTKVSHMLQAIFGDNQRVEINVDLNNDELQRELIRPQKQGQLTHEKQVTSEAAKKSAKHKQIISSEKSYQYGTEKESFKRASGTIKRVSVSVLLPKSCEPETQKQVENLVKSIVGFNHERNDSINVAALLEQKE